MIEGAPTANHDVFLTFEDESITLDLIANDISPEGYSLRIESIAGVDVLPLPNESSLFIHLGDGLILLDPEGVVTFIPSLDFNGSVNFNYIVSDGTGRTASGLVSGTVMAVNDPIEGEIWIDGSASEGQILTAGFSLNDSDGIPAEGAGTIAVQWYSDDLPIQGATGLTLTLTEAEIGKVISVMVHYTDLGGTTESLRSTATTPVTLVVTDSSTVDGMVYHWKNHSLLTNVKVAALDDSAGTPEDSPLIDWRKADFDPLTGRLTAEVWANASAAGDDNFDFTVKSAHMKAASFESALAGGWTVLTNDETPGSLIVRGFNAESSGGSLVSSVKLGVMQLDFVQDFSDTQIELIDVAVGEVAEPVAPFGVHVRQSNIEGTYAIEGLSAGSYGVDVDRPATDSGNAITSADALAALRIAVGLNPNPLVDGVRAPVSPYQIMAADVNNSGTVTSADALAVLRMAVKLSTALPQEWLFVEETRDFWNEDALDGVGAFTLSRQSATWDREILVDPDVTGASLNLVGILKGDVNGSWTAPAGSARLPDGHLDAVAELIGVPVEQWG